MKIKGVIDCAFEEFLGHRDVPGAFEAKDQEGGWERRDQREQAAAS